MKATSWEADEQPETEVSEFVVDPNPTAFIYLSEGATDIVQRLIADVHVYEFERALLRDEVNKQLENSK